MTMIQWTIYDHPRDYPEHFVVRKWEITDGHISPCPEKYLAATLPEARAHVPAGYYNLGRMDDDDPVIIETWI